MTRTTAFLLALLLAVPAFAQVGKSVGVVDANTAAEADLAKMPSMTPEIAKALVAARPFDSATALNTFLLGQKLTQDQASAFYRSAFVHINLNTASEAEIMLIPGAGKRMAHEFEEYRPWRTWAQFEKEIGKYVDAKEVARLGQYRLHPAEAEYRDRSRFHDHPRRRQAHGPRVRGVSPVEDPGAVREGDWKVRQREGGQALLALHGD